ncbi:MAG: HTTM domain-containing protein [Candidatus Poribacteria bacterium]|nr:HTTM domain-containing protein [Candidatus Poribacteria bacterium]
MLNRLQRFRYWALCYYDSTRSVALIRIGLALLIWSRWGDEFLLFRDIHLSAILFNSAFFLATALMFVGLWTRVASLATAIILWFMYLEHESWRHHHIYLLVIATSLIALTPSDRSYSCDRWFALRRASRLGLPAPPEIGNLWGLRLISIQMSMIYFWSGYEKLYWGFLSGARMQHYIYNDYSGPDYKNIPGFAFLCFVSAIITVSLEFVLSFGLFIPKLRKLLIPAGIVLHILFYVLLPVRTFSLNMMLLYLAFIPAASIHRFIDNMHGDYSGLDKS